MKKRRLKKSVEYLLFGFVFVATFFAVFMIETNTNKELDDLKLDIVSIDSDDSLDKPVVKIGNSIIRPYSNNEVRILKDFYDNEDESVEQENSLIYFEGTYLQSSGVVYGGIESFDVISILDGSVSSITEDDLLGKIIEIDHNNGIIGYYQGVDDIKVKKGDFVKQGDVIAKSGTSNILKELDNNLNFELSINGKLVNPEKFYDKNISDLNS